LTSPLSDPTKAAFERLRRAESIGRPLGGEAFLTRLGAATSRIRRPAKRGRRPSTQPTDDENVLSALSP
jgi:putative transposase